eukprot:2888249-Pleurochrysis_carterae.AAC.20
MSPLDRTTAVNAHGLLFRSELSACYDSAVPEHHYSALSRATETLPAASSKRWSVRRHVHIQSQFRCCRGRHVSKLSAGRMNEAKLSQQVPLPVDEECSLAVGDTGIVDRLA